MVCKYQHFYSSQSNHRTWCLEGWGFSANHCCNLGSSISGSKLVRILVFWVVSPWKAGWLEESSSYDLSIKGCRTRDAPLTKWLWWDEVTDKLDGDPLVSLFPPSWCELEDEWLWLIPPCSSPPANLCWWEEYHWSNLRLTSSARFCGPGPFTSWQRVACKCYIRHQAWETRTYRESAYDAVLCASKKEGESNEQVDDN